MMSQLMTFVFILFDLLAICSLLIGIFTSSLILFIITRKRARHHAIANLLLTNTCLCTLELCLSNLLIYGFIIASDCTSMTALTSLYDQQTLCPLRSYFLFTGFCLLYTSYCLQAYYRLLQVVFYKKQYSYAVFVYLCVIQWILSFLIVLPMLLTRSFVYLPAEFFCPIPFTKPLSVAYIAISVYGIFLIIFISIYLRIYIYARQTTSITIRRRRTIDRHFTMLKRMILPAFSLLFLGIVYLTFFFRTLANQHQIHFLTYRLSYLFIAIGMGFMHIITILQTPSIRGDILELFSCLKRRMWRIEENSNTAIDNLNTTTQQQQQQGEKEQISLLDYEEVQMSQYGKERVLN